MVRSTAMHRFERIRTLERGGAVAACLFRPRREEPGIESSNRGSMGRSQRKEPTAATVETAQRDVSARTFNLVQRLYKAAVLFLLLALAFCGDALRAPSRGVVVTFRVVDETFRVHLLHKSQINAAHQAASAGRARIPIGRVVPGTGVNAGWSWHLQDVEFAGTDDRRV